MFISRFSVCYLGFVCALWRRLTPKRKAQEEVRGVCVSASGTRREVQTENGLSFFWGFPRAPWCACVSVNIPNPKPNNITEELSKPQEWNQAGICPVPVCHQYTNVELLLLCQQNNRDHGGLLCRTTSSCGAAGTSGDSAAIAANTAALMDNTGPSSGPHER